MNFYSHHIGDYTRDTAHLSWDEDCAYRRMLCWYYLHERPLPGNLEQVCRLIGAKTDQQIASAKQVLSECFVLLSGCYSQKRCDREIALYRERIEKRKMAGSMGGHAKKGYKNRRLQSKIASAKQMDSKRVALQPPTSNLQPPIYKDINPLIKSSNGDRLAVDWILQEDWRQDAIEILHKRNIELDIDSMADAFRDFWHGKAGKDGRKLDWRATWRNWVRSSNPPKTGNGSHNLYEVERQRKAAANIAEALASTEDYSK